MEGNRADQRRAIELDNAPSLAADFGQRIQHSQLRLLGPPQTGAGSVPQKRVQREPVASVWLAARDLGQSLV